MKQTIKHLIVPTTAGRPGGARRTAIALVLLLLTTATAWADNDPATIGGITYNADGGYYEINEPDDLRDLATYVNGTGTYRDNSTETTAHNCSGLKFKMTDDITFTHDTDWNDAESTENNYVAISGYYGGYRYFSGDFDGAGHTISGIRIYRSGTDNTDYYQGIFGWTTDGANIHGLRLADTRITGYNFTGGIVGLNYGTVTDCHVANNVCIHAVQPIAYYHGGIAGWNRGTVANCTSAATLTIASDANGCQYYGAIAGCNEVGTLSDNLAIGATVPAAADNTHGAIAGVNFGGTLQRNYYTACKVADVENATNVGCANADVAAADGAVPAVLTQNGNTYTISNTGGWDVFCYLLANNAKGYFDGKTVKLGANITVSRMAGGSYHDFTGTFDGQGHTLTVSYTATEDNCAPFRYAEGCTIRNLHVDGTITTSAKFAAGIIAQQYGAVTIRNCRVSVAISSSVSGDGTHGGLVAVKNSNSGSNITIEGCLFDGSLLGSATNKVGGFIGWRGGTATISNSLFAPTEVTVQNDNSATFARNKVDTYNSYYTHLLNDGTNYAPYLDTSVTPAIWNNGKAPRTVAAGDNVTIEAIALTGDATNYDVSGITAYSGGGLQHGDNLYYGSGDQLELTLSNTATAGYQYDGYTASAGTLSGSTLTMPDADVTISLGDLTVIDWAGTGDKDDPFIIRYPSQLDLLAYRVNGTHGETAVEDGYSGKYFRLANDITYTHDTDWDDDGSEENNYEAIGDGLNDRFFCGDFDGAGHTISGIRIYRSGSTNADSYQGIFGWTGGANIHGLRLADARITGYEMTGGIVGLNGGTVTDCHVASNVCIHAVQTGDYGAYYHGGIAGRNEDTVEYSTSAATLTIAPGATDCYSYGAIAGYNSGILRDNLAIGATVPAADDNSHGAIAGHNSSGTLQRNYYTACNVAGVANATNVGCQNADVAEMTKSNVTYYDGAVPAVLTQNENTYTISNTGGWDVFCYLLANNAKGHFTGKTVELANNITVTWMAGSSGHEFTGTFDGQGHTLTVGYGTADDPFGEEYAAPFRYLEDGCTIKNLHVAGHIYTAAKYAGGLAGDQYGDVTIQNCRSSVTIQSSVENTNNDGTHGGFIAYFGGKRKHLSFEGCVFDGKLLTTNGISHCGGFVGWANGVSGTTDTEVTFTNCLYAPAAIADADGETEVGTSESATFARKNNNNNTVTLTFTNCYYTRTLGTAQGKALHSVTAGDDVTIDAIALTGTPTQYSVSGIIAYSGGGLQLGDDLYYGTGDQLELTLSNTAPEAPLGYEYDGYTASAGTLSGTTLTMPDEDVTISLALAVIDWANEGRSGDNAADPYMIYNKDQLDLLAHRVNGTHGETLQEDGYSGKYFQLGADIAYNHSTDWNDADCEQENNYEAIGGYYGSNYRSFSGDFDGADHTVSGIRIHRSGSTNADSYQGIFGMTMDANIHGLRLANARITGYRSLGGIVGYNFNGSTVTGCHVANNVCINAVQSNAWRHGGIAGENRGTVENCTSAATLTIPYGDSGCLYYGAIAGYNNATLRDNLAIGATVPAASLNTHGAIVGVNDGGTLQRNYYTACKVASENVTPSGVGCYNADVATNDGAVPALRDNADNTKAIALLAALASTTDNHTPVNLGWGAGQFPMQLAGRTLYKDGSWNTLCLPFSLSALEGTPLEGATIMELGNSTACNTGFDAASGTLTLDFVPANSIEAGHAYIVKWTRPDSYVAYDGTNASECSDLVSPVFQRVTASSEDPADQSATSQDGAVTFTGTYGPVSIPADGDNTLLYLGAQNTLYWPSAAMTIGSHRAYFRLNDGLTTGEPASGSRAVRAFALNFGDERGDEATGIVSMSADAKDNGAWYTLDGRRLSGKPTRRGLYIHGGQKVYVK